MIQDTGNRERRTYAIKLDDYDIEILKNRPRYVFINNHISKEVIEDILKQIMQQHRNYIKKDRIATKLCK